MSERKSDLETVWAWGREAYWRTPDPMETVVIQLYGAFGARNARRLLLGLFDGEKHTLPTYALTSWYQGPGAGEVGGDRVTQLHLFTRDLAAGVVLNPEVPQAGAFIGSNVEIHTLVENFDPQASLLDNGETNWQDGIRAKRIYRDRIEEGITRFCNRARTHIYVSLNDEATNTAGIMFYREDDFPEEHDQASMINMAPALDRVSRLGAAAYE